MGLLESPRHPVALALMLLDTYFNLGQGSYNLGPVPRVALSDQGTWGGGSQATSLPGRLGIPATQE